MSDARAAILGEIATEAGIERTTFLTDAADQLNRFLDANKGHIRELGGMVLIDDDPDYLSIAPDGTFRSRSRYQDDVTGQWVSETEVIDNASELVELYNPADIYSAFAEAARAEAGLVAEPTGAQDLFEAAGVSSVDTVGTPVDPYAEAADDWAAAQDETLEPDDATDAARRLYDLALTFQERSQVSEARLIEQFESAAEPLSRVLGDQMLLDDEDERLWFRATGSFEAEVLPERDEDDTAEGQWSALKSAEDMVQFYDPTDLFGDLAESLAETYPEVAPASGEDSDDEEGTDEDDEEEADDDAAADDEADDDDGDAIDDDDKPSDSQATDSTASDGKASDGKASDGKASDGKANDDKPTDGKPSPA